MKTKVSRNDDNGPCRLVLAAQEGHLEAVKFLLQCDWSCKVNKNEAMQQALVAAAGAGHRHIVEYMLELHDQDGKGAVVDKLDTLQGETALTAACVHGHTDVVHVLLGHRDADIHFPNGKSVPPLLCAVKGGHWDVVHCLLRAGADVEQRDRHDRTALMIAACEGHVGVLELLLSKGASVTAEDREGLTALCWACVKGHFLCVQTLLERGSAIHHTDRNGRCPLDLAATGGEAQLVQYLLDNGADLDHADVIGMRPLDRAIGARNGSVVACFLKRGAKLGSATWAMAAGKPDILILLLNKLREDGTSLYKKNRLKEAGHRYAYALKKFPSKSGAEGSKTFTNLKISLMLNLSRCQRKLGDLKGAIDLASQVLEMKPDSYEAYYARARAERDQRKYTKAIEDLEKALEMTPNCREISRLLAHVKRECKEKWTINSLESISEESDELGDLTDSYNPRFEYNPPTPVHSRA